MDTGNGNFKMYEDMAKLLDENPERADGSRVFKVGEVIEIRGSRFKIKSINPKGMRLKLLKREDTLMESASMR